MSGFFQFLTWLEVMNTRNEVESNASQSATRVLEQARKSRDEKVVTLYQELFRAQNIDQVNLGVIDQVAKHSQANYNANMHRNAPGYAVFKPLVGVGVFAFLVVMIPFFKNLVDGDGVFMKIVAVGIFGFFVFMGAGLIMEFTDSKEARKRYFRNKKALIAKLPALRQEYGMLSLYGMKLKSDIDRPIRRVYGLLYKEDSERAKNALRLLYKCFELPPTTPLKTDEDFGLLGFVDAGIEELYKSAS